MTKATIIVQASAEHPDILDIREAMHQVLDFFEFLSSDEDKNVFVWNLAFAATNSPFTATAEAVSLHSGVDVRAIANARMSEASEFMFDLANGHTPRRQINAKRTRYAKSVLRRNMGSIGKTTVLFDLPKTEPVTLTPSISEKALGYVDVNSDPVFTYLPEKRERNEIGSVEGSLVHVGTDYNLPSIRITERKSGREINCRVEPHVIESIDASTNFRDVWEHKRVTVRGRIFFGADGQISRVHARSVSVMHPRDMTLHDIEDRAFTDNEPITSYLDKLREG